MISKAQLDQISFIYENVVEKDHFSSCLAKKLVAYQKKKLSKEELDSWLDSWEAAAELDQDPRNARKIRRAHKEIKSKGMSWEQFKRTVGLS